MMNDYGKSDSLVVPEKSSNKVCQRMAETREERGLAEGNPVEQNACRTQSRKDVPSALERIRQAAKKDNLSSLSFRATAR
jgi:hypothetical protein